MAWRLNFFPVPEDITYSLLNILFDIFWDSINLVYVSKLVEEGLVYDYLFTSQRESFCYTLLVLPHLKLSRIELSKLTSMILIEIVTIPVALVDQFYFYIHQSKKAWLFEKIIL